MAPVRSGFQESDKAISSQRAELGSAGPPHDCVRPLGGGARRAEGVECADAVQLQDIASLNVSASARGSRAFHPGVETVAIVLTASLLLWLRELPTRRALHILKLISELLRKHGESAWPGKLEALSGQLRAAQDAADPDRLVNSMQAILMCFRGSPSLSALILSSQNGHKIKPEVAEAVNARLGALRTQLYLSARQTIARVEWRQHRRMA